jgi:Ser/Thr protein kinase RdoA (MazF antagonist)
MPPAGPLGRFQLTDVGNGFFVRISARWAHPQLEQALAGFLAEGGIAVNPLTIAGEEFRYEGQSYRFDVRPLLEGRHFDGSLGDLRTLAAALAKCHQRLAHFPGSAEVARLAAERFSNLDRVLGEIGDLVATDKLQRFASDQAWGSGRAAWLRQMVDEAKLRFDLEPGAQALHAQVHRGNVLYRLSDNAPVLLDFEEAVHTFATPAWDTAHLVQRFCLHDQPAEAVFTERLAVLREAYGAPLGDLPTMMRRIAWLSIVILINDHMQHGAGAPVAEYEKFVTLETQAREYAALMA